jgi:hypothetical protein
MSEILSQTLESNCHNGVGEIERGFKSNCGTSKLDTERPVRIF